MTFNGGDVPWLWPMGMGMRMGAATLDAFGAMLTPSTDRQASHEPTWMTPHEIVLDTPALRVRVFGRGRGQPALIVTPYALHGPVLADLAPGHSLVQTLMREGLDHLALLEWKSAGPQTRHLAIDDYLLRLSAVLDDFGRPSSVIGLCQGGWLSLMLAARFPDKVSRLVLAGAPVDLDAAPSSIVTAARDTDPASIGAVIQANAGLMPGRTLMSAWSARGLEQPALTDMLQVDEPSGEAVARFHAWHSWILDLPGAYYLEVFAELFRRNKLARGEYQALGRVLDLSTLRTPLFLIAGERDEVTPPEQLLAVGRLVGTAPDQIATARAGGTHLSLFMGAQNLETVWKEAARWLRQDQEQDGAQPPLGPALGEHTLGEHTESRISASTLQAPRLALRQPQPG